MGRIDLTHLQSGHSVDSQEVLCSPDRPPEHSLVALWSHAALQATFTTQLMHRRKRHPRSLAQYLNRTLFWRHIADYNLLTKHSTTSTWGWVPSRR
jgi:hypothetical protein